MVMHLNLGVLIVAVFTSTVADADITVDCKNGSVSVTWRIGAEVVPYAHRLFLGSCMPLHMSTLPTGDADVEFDYNLNDCKITRMMKRKRLVYKTALTFRPYPKPQPATFTYPIECVYKRPDGWVPPSLYPGSGVSEGRGELIFHMALLNEELTAIANTNIIPLGSFMPIWAAVEQKSHQPLLLLMEECVAATTSELQPDSQVYPIITNKGCLLDSIRGNSRFLPRYHTSALTVYLQSFKFGLGEEVYIHCKLVAWDPEVLTENRKACHYLKENESWELLDDPNRSTLCSCCDSSCKSRAKRGIIESQGLGKNAVLGPLIIVDHSESKDRKSLV
ncbi:zona pellucida sperm-binding protein 3-like [Genypterus blacodes]|uniref:zona pellucida sperm-binding protein 3-like n=1 Tax=Genypterus blacodes TaxID=154954 RepID=UPI003F76D675